MTKKTLRPKNLLEAWKEETKNARTLGIIRDELFGVLLDTTEPIDNKVRLLREYFHRMQVVDGDLTSALGHVIIDSIRMSTRVLLVEASSEKTEHLKELFEYERQDR